MNIIKVAEGAFDTGEGAMDLIAEAAPVIADLKQHKDNLDKEGAGTGKKSLVLAGYAFMHFMERWPQLKPGVMEVKAGVIEMIEGWKEPGLGPDDLRRMKDTLDNKKRQKCEILLPKDPVETAPEEPKKPEPPKDVKIPEPDPKEQNP